MYKYNVAMILLLLSTIAGFLGSILGLGGGIIIVPALTLIYQVDIRHAVAASLLSIVATSSAASMTYFKENLTNIRVGVFLQVSTVAGALSGFLVSNYISSRYIFVLFGVFLIFSGILMLRKRQEDLATQNHPMAEYLKLGGENYYVDRPLHAFVWMYLAGILSALLGIGSGILKVLAMDGYMKLPLKVSTATSNFMIGVTAAASAGAYLLNGEVYPEIAGPVVIGITLGSWVGANMLKKIPEVFIRILFFIVVLITSVQMFWKGFYS